MTASEDLELLRLELEYDRPWVRDSLRDADQSFSARRRIIGSVSASRTSSGNVSSTEIDFVGRSGITGFSSIPRKFVESHPVAAKLSFKIDALQTSQFADCLGSQFR